MGTQTIEVPGASSETEIVETQARLAPHVRVQTVERLTRDDVSGLHSLDANLGRRIDKWASRAVQAGNAAVLAKLGGEIDFKGQAPCTLQELSKAIGNARDALGDDRVNLLIGEALYGELDLDENAPVPRALRGGKVAPARGGLGKDQLYVLKEGAGDVVVVVSQNLRPEWDVHIEGGVELLASEDSPSLPRLLCLLMSCACVECVAGHEPLDS